MEKATESVRACVQIYIIVNAYNSSAIAQHCDERACVCGCVCVFASDTLRISGFLLMTSYLHKQAFANASRRHRHAEAVRLIFAALGLARRNTRFRQRTLGTTS